MVSPRAAVSPTSTDDTLSALEKHWETRGHADPFGFGPLGRTATPPEPIDYYHSGVRQVRAWLQLLQRLGLPSQLDRALDFGCGAGRLTHALAEHVARVDGVDISRSLLTTAQAVENETVTFHHNPRPDLRIFADQSFDLIVAIATFEHLPRTLGRGYLRELARVLKPGGALLITLPPARGARRRTLIGGLRGLLRPDEADPLTAREFETLLPGLGLICEQRPTDRGDLAVYVVRRPRPARQATATQHAPRRSGLVDHATGGWLRQVQSRMAPMATPWRDVWPAFVVSRLLIVVVAFLTIHAMPSPPGVRHAETVADAFTRWDYPWYASIVLDGYTFTPGEQCNVIFLPLFPVLMGLVSLTGLKLKFAGILVSNLALLSAAVVLWKWVERLTDARTARLATWLLLLGPVSFFFSIPYSEATFFLGAVGALYAAQTNRWWLAGLAGAAAAATRSVGVLLVVPLLLAAWETRSRQAAWWSPANRHRLLCACLPLGGTAVYLGILAWNFGDPFLYTKVEQHWGRVLMPFWETFAHGNVAILPLFYQVWFCAPILVGCLLVLYGIRQVIAPSLLAMCTVFLVVYTSTGTLEATPRYVSVLAPIYLLGGLWLTHHPRWTIPTLASCAVLLTFSVGMFANGHWFT